MLRTVLFKTLRMMLSALDKSEKTCNAFSMLSRQCVIQSCWLKDRTSSPSMCMCSRTRLPASYSTWEETEAEVSVRASVEAHAGRELRLKIATSWIHKFPPTYCTPKPPTEHPLQKYIQHLCSDKYVLKLRWRWCGIALLSLLCCTPAVSGSIRRFGLSILAHFPGKKFTSCNGKVCKFTPRPSTESD